MWHGVRQVAQAVGEKVRACRRKVEELRQRAFLPCVQMRPFAILRAIVGLRHHAQRNMLDAQWRAAGAQMRHHLRVEALEADRPVIGRRASRHALRQPQIAIEAALDLADQRRHGADQRQELGQGGDQIAAAQPHAPQFLRREGVDAAGVTGQPLQREIVEDDGLPIFRQLHVAFDGEGLRDGRAGGADAVLDCPPGPAIMQAAMGDGARGEPVGRVNHSNSNMASTSTEASRGSSATPTVVRA